MLQKVYTISYIGDAPPQSEALTDKHSTRFRTSHLKTKKTKKHTL